MIPEYMRREINRAIHDAEHPAGMGVHNGMARIHAATLRRLVALAEASPASERPVLWVHQDNFGLATTREPLGADWVPLYRRPAATLIDPKGSLGEPIV